MIGAGGNEVGWHARHAIAGLAEVSGQVLPRGRAVGGGQPVGQRRGLDLVLLGPGRLQRVHGDQVAELLVGARHPAILARGTSEVSRIWCRTLKRSCAVRKSRVNWASRKQEPNGNSEHAAWFNFAAVSEGGFHG